MSLIDEVNTGRLLATPTDPYEYITMQKIGNLDIVIEFIERLGAYDYLYFLQPNDIWRCFDFCFNKLKNNAIKISEKDFMSNLKRIYRINNRYAIVLLMNKKEDPYEISRLIVLAEGMMDPKRKISPLFGNPDPKLLERSIEILNENKGKDYDFHSISERLLCKKFPYTDIKRTVFRFYSTLFENLASKKLPYSNKTLAEKSSDSEFATKSLNKMAQISLKNIVNLYISRTKPNDEIMSEYHSIMALLDERQKEFEDKLNASLNV